MLRIGQKVICIKKDDKWDKQTSVRFKLTHKVISPDVGDICEIDEIRTEYDHESNIALKNWPYYYIADYFRPLAYKSQSMEHDIELFNKMMKDVGETV